MDKKPTFVSILTFIFLVFIMLADFLGALYITDGNIALSIVISAIVVICYFYVIALLVSNKEAMVKNNYKHYSLLFWAFYLCLGLGSFYFMNHFFNVEINCKETVKKEALDRLQLLHTISDEYETRLNNDLNKLEINTNLKLNEFQNHPNNRRLRSELEGAPYFISSTTLSDPYNMNVFAISQVSLNGVKEKYKTFTEMLTKNVNNTDSIYRPVFDNWRRLSLMSGLNDVDAFLKQTKDSINVKLAELPFNKDTLSVNVHTELTPLNNPSKIKELHPNSNSLLSILIILVIHVFLLIPFFLQEIRVYNTNKNKSNNSSGGEVNNGSIEI